MISFANINKQYGKQLLFVDASFQLNPGEKVGLVGPNGAGKTTLFRMVIGEETPDEGAVSVPKKLNENPRKPGTGSCKEIVCAILRLQICRGTFAAGAYELR